MKYKNIIGFRKEQFSFNSPKLLLLYRDCISKLHLIILKVVAGLITFQNCPNMRSGQKIGEHKIDDKKTMRANKY